MEDLLVNRTGNRVIGLLLDGGSRLRGHKVYPMEEVRAVGEGAIVVNRSAVVLHTRRGRRLARLQAGRADLVGKRLVTREGDDLGIIADLVFDPDSGAVLGYELSGGFIRDVTEGKGFIPVTADLTVGRDAVISPPLEKGSSQPEGGREA